MFMSDKNTILQITILCGKLSIWHFFQFHLNYFHNFDSFNGKEQRDVWIWPNKQFLDTCSKTIEWFIFCTIEQLFLLLMSLIWYDKFQKNQKVCPNLPSLRSCLFLVRVCIASVAFAGLGIRLVFVYRMQ